MDSVMCFLSSRLLECGFWIVGIRFEPSFKVGSQVIELGFCLNLGVSMCSIPLFHGHGQWLLLSSDSGKVSLSLETKFSMLS